MDLHVVVNETDCPRLFAALIYRGIGKHGVLNPRLPILGSPRYENNHRGALGTTSYRNRTRYSSPTISPVSRSRERRETKKTNPRRGGAPARRCDPPEYPELSPSLQTRPWRSTSPTLSPRPWVLISLHSTLAPLTSRPFSLTLSVKSFARYSTLNNLHIPTPLTRHLTLRTHLYRHVYDWYSLVKLYGELYILLFRGFSATSATISVFREIKIIDLEVEEILFTL